MALNATTALDPKTTALILIEYQNDFTTEGGAFHGGVKGVMESTNMLANTVTLIEQARAAGVTIMFVPISFAKGYNEITATPYGILKGVVDNQAFVEGTWGAEITTALPRKSTDILVEGKRGAGSKPPPLSSARQSTPSASAPAKIAPRAISR